jgi:uncharacterized protein YegL
MDMPVTVFHKDVRAQFRKFFEHVERSVGHASRSAADQDPFPPGVDIFKRLFFKQI